VSGRKSDLAAKVAWLYFVGNHTQQEIAETLNVSRPTVQRLIASATESGFVQVRISRPTHDCMEVAEQLCKRFKLTQCDVAPTEPGSDAGTLRAIAVTGAAVMERYLSHPGLAVLAMGSGRTIKAVVDEVAETSLPQLKILSLAGAIALDGAFNRYDCGLRMADRTSGKHYLLPMPVIAPTIADRDAWNAHRLHKVLDDLYEQAEAAFIGIGTIAPGSPLLEDGFLSEEELLDLIRLGAVGEILGWPLDAEGKLVASPLTDRITSPRLAKLAMRPVIAFAAGRRKVPAILAALRGGWLRGLVTDFETAQLILQAA
jgi:DNA-binding transcriptional regulator LsrR (DeoR family)